MANFIKTPVCRIWSKFAPKKRDGNVIKLRVQDMPQEKYSDVIDLFMKFFAPYEPTHVAAGVHRSTEALKDCRRYLTETLNKPSYKIFICCPDETNEVQTVLGASVIELITEWPTFASTAFQTKEMKKSYEIYNNLISQVNLIEKYSLDKYYDGRGIVVDFKYKSLGIGVELIRVRQMVCKEHDVPLTGAWTTSHSAQMVTDRVKWDLICEVKYEDLSRDCGVKFDNVPPTCKLLVGKPL